MANSENIIHMDPSQQGTVKGGALLRQLMTMQLLKDYTLLTAHTKDHEYFHPGVHLALPRLKRKLIEGVKFRIDLDVIDKDILSLEERSKILMLLSYTHDSILLPYPTTVFEYSMKLDPEGILQEDREVIVAEQKENGNIVLSGFPMETEEASNRSIFFIDSLNVEINPTVDITGIISERYNAVDVNDEEAINYITESTRKLIDSGFLVSFTQIPRDGKRPKIHLTIGRFLLIMKILNGFSIEDRPLQMTPATRQRVSAKELPALRYHELILNPSTIRSKSVGTKTGTEHPYGTRRAHKRRLKSGKVVNVRAYEVNKHKKGQSELRKHYAVGKST